MATKKYLAEMTSTTAEGLPRIVGAQMEVSKELKQAEEQLLETQEHEAATLAEISNRCLGARNEASREAVLQEYVVKV